MHNNSRVWAARRELELICLTSPGDITVSNMLERGSSSTESRRGWRDSETTWERKVDHEMCRD